MPPIFGFMEQERQKFLGNDENLLAMIDQASH